ncbi:uncharacterized protein LOC144711907 [Wolffia australiana]
MEKRVKRQLPIWMQKSADREEIGKKNSKSSSKKATEETGKDPCSSDDVSISKIGEKDFRSSQNDSKSYISSRGKPVIGKKASKRRKAPNPSESRDEKKIEGARLTVDDLSSIAKEIVNGEEREEERGDSLSRNERENNAQDSREGIEPARDMLDVFLGPLLRKPVEAGRVDLCSWVEKEGKESFLSLPMSGNPLGEEERRAVKRKTSLRDKVAPYLD